MQMPAGVASDLPLIESRNPKNSANVGKHPDKDKEKIMSVTETSSKVYKPKIYE